MRVSIDGGHTWQDADNGVQIIYSDLTADNPHDIEETLGGVQLLVNCTSEGLIQDVIHPNCGENYASEYLGTSSQMAQEIVDELT
jgi:hypothetical protein